MRARRKKLENNSIFIAGYETKYPEILLKGRMEIEANVIGSVWSDPQLLLDHQINITDFITVDGRYLFKIAKCLADKHIPEFDEGAVITNLPSIEFEEFKSYGGYECVKDIMDRTNIKNAESYISLFHKSNLFMKLYDSGFPVDKPVDDGKGHKVIPIEACSKYDYEETSDWFDALLARVTKDQECTSKIVQENLDFLITDEIIDSLTTGQMTGTGFGDLGTDPEDLDVKGNKVKTFPYLDNEICGFRPRTTNALCGYSSTGKTMLMCEILLGLAAHGERITIISNEMDQTAYYANFICFLAYRKFRYSKLTRTKLATGEMTDEDKAYLRKIQAYYNEKFKGCFRFHQITDADMQQVKRIIKRDKLEYGITTVFYDTMKADISDYNDKEPAYLSLIRDSRVLDTMAKRYDLIVLVTIQIASSTKGRAWIDEGCISNSKQIIEVMETCLMLRNCYGEAETSNESKTYINPFRKPAPGRNDSYTPIALQPDKNYSLLFITKNRAGNSSERTGEVLLLEADTKSAVFHEFGWAKPSRAFIGASSNK